MNTSNTLSPRAKEIANILLDIDAVLINLETPFTWVSEMKSPIYCNNRLVNSYPEKRDTLVEAFCELINENFPDEEITICGVATGGIPIGSIIANRLNVPFLYVRQAAKKHGLQQQVEGHFNKGDKVIVIEDHISTGGSSLNAVDALEDVGLNVLALVSIMTYDFKIAKERFKNKGLTQYNICNLDTIVDAALELGKITEDEKHSVLEFRDNPNEWGKRYNV